jgi:hypothetical protein
VGADANLCQKIRVLARSDQKQIAQGASCTFATTFGGDVVGHGFGLRKAIGKPAEIWPELFLNFARTQGF